uniref:Uncharacterized protein n=1 Tax=Panagrolaimus davidi TaxID=227884 RepID=A0A914QY00_9BILA
MEQFIKISNLVFCGKEEPQWCGSWDDDWESILKEGEDWMEYEFDPNEDMQFLPLPEEQNSEHDEQDDVFTYDEDSDDEWNPKAFF